MRIAYLCTDLEISAFHGGGAAVHIRDFTDALLEAGHDVFIVGPWTKDSSEHAPRARLYTIQPDGVDAFVWNTLSDDATIVEHQLERDVRFLLYNSLFVRQALRILEQERPDLILQRESLFGWAGLELARLLNVPLVLEINAPSCLEQDGYDQFRFVDLARRLERKVLQSADAIIAVSRWIGDWVVAEGVDRSAVHVIPNGVNGRLFTGMPSGESIRSRYHLEKARVIGHVGTFQAWHDVEGLVSAFANLLRRDRSLRLLLIGEGERRKDIARLIEKLGVGSAVIFTGRIAHAEMPAHLAAMDIAVVPYAKGSENNFYFSPLKLFEAMAAGVATVAPAFGQIADVIDHQQTGWLYDPADPAGLERALSDLLADPNGGRAIGLNARGLMLRDYTWDSVAERAVRIAEGLIELRRDRVS